MGLDDILLRLRTKGMREGSAEIRDVAGSTGVLGKEMLSAREAAIQQERATLQLDGAIRRYGRDSLEARDSAVKLERANHNLSRAQLDVKGSFDEQGAAVTNTGVDLLDLGKKAGLAAAAFLALDSAMNVANQALDRGMTNDVTAAALGLSPRAARKAGRVAADAYAQGYGESINEVYAAITSVGTNLADIEELKPGALGRLVRRSLNITAVFGPEVNEVTRVVGDQLRNGMVRNSEDAFNLLVAGFQRGANKSDEFLDTLREYAEPVRSLGLDMRDFTNILVSGAEAGVYSSDRLGDALKEFSIRAIDGSATTRNAFRALGLDARDLAQDIAAGGPSARTALATVVQGLQGVGDRVRRERIGVNLFGSIWEDVGEQAIRALDPTEDALGSVGRAARRLDKTMSAGPKQTMDRFFRDLENDAVNVIGGVVIPLIEGDFDRALRNMQRSFAVPIEGIRLGFEAIANSSIWALNQMIEAYNVLPDGIDTPFGRIELFNDIDGLSYVGAYGERILSDADAQTSAAIGAGRTPRQILRQYNRATSGAPPSELTPVGGPIGRTSRSLTVTAPIYLNDREIARGVGRGQEKDDGFRTP